MEDTGRIDQATVGRLVRQDVYPINNPVGRDYAKLVDRCRRDLVQTGYCRLGQFLSHTAIQLFQSEVGKLAAHAHRAQEARNIYGTADDPSLPKDHPARLFAEHTNCLVPADLVTTTSPLRGLYESEAFRQFLETCRNTGRLYRYADPLADMPINVMEPGSTLPWHYDAVGFSVTLLVQDATSGGVFEYAPFLRDTEGERLAEVRDVLLGRSAIVQHVEYRPGDLMMYRGWEGLHRVTTVGGDRSRATVLYGFSDSPGEVADPSRLAQLFGRVKPLAN